MNHYLSFWLWAEKGLCLENAIEAERICDNQSWLCVRRTQKSLLCISRYWRVPHRCPFQLCLDGISKTDWYLLLAFYKCPSSVISNKSGAHPPIQSRDPSWLDLSSELPCLLKIEPGHHRLPQFSSFGHFFLFLWGHSYKIFCLFIPLVLPLLGSTAHSLCFPLILFSSCWNIPCFLGIWNSLCRKRKD